MISRREALVLGGAALATATLPCPPAAAQTPRRGGTVTIRAWDPPYDYGGRLVAAGLDR